MTDDIRQMLAALGAALVSAFGATAPAPAPAEPKPAPAAQPEPAPMKGKRAPMPRKEKTCIVCGAAYMTGAPQKSLLCPHCRILRVNGNKQFIAAFETAKKKLAAGGEVPAPAVPEGKIRCERMHATIPATMCGTREECHGCKEGAA